MTEIYAAAKETVALAEQRFMSNSHEWQFDNAWQEMLNHATIKVMEAETQKTESGAEHQQKALIFNAAEQKVQQLEEKYRRFIIKSRPYFEENQICQDQLKTQKGRISELQQMIQVAKSRYANALRSLEGISEDIHRQRGDLPVPTGPREPGVGAELSSPAQFSEFSRRTPLLFDHELDDTKEGGLPDELLPPDEQEADEDDDMDDEEDEEDSNEAREDDEDLESLRRKVKVLAIRPVEGGEGKQQEQKTWENELNATVNKLDHLMMMRELGQKCTSSSVPTTPRYTPMRSTSPLPPIKMLRGGGQLPLMNSSLNELSVAKLMPYVMPFSTAVPPTGALNMAVGGGNMGTASAGSFKEQPKRKLSI